MTGGKKQETVKCKPYPPYSVSSGLSGVENGAGRDAWGEDVPFFTLSCPVPLKVTARDGGPANGRRARTRVP